MVNINEMQGNIMSDSV